MALGAVVAVGADEPVPALPDEDLDHAEPLLPGHGPPELGAEATAGLEVVGLLLQVGAVGVDVLRDDVAVVLQELGTGALVHGRGRLGRRHVLRGVGRGRRGRARGRRGAVAVVEHVTGQRDAQRDHGDSGDGATGREQPVQPEPAAAAGEVVLEPYVGGGMDAPSLPEALVHVVHACSPGVAATDSASRRRASASEVWLFTVPGLIPRSAAVSSTDRPQ